ncbi:DUF1559 family PulG-like putative transporter [Thalassoglobus polymorphus]|uniref:DUF1559 domain-containing protein n=1 Tax=Thalassoglobus polymorphus TaxID=2527994 RepID=A0A517QMD2_9PLAN|nr:DUF1559 domain-containing protein [Thalassoglobus polymorphus]QDT32798.1 hypothetical protein Mal48_20450 [Thalassoglobus polymorphus]
MIFKSSLNVNFRLVNAICLVAMIFVILLKQSALSEPAEKVEPAPSPVTAKKVSNDDPPPFPVFTNKINYSETSETFPEFVWDSHRDQQRTESSTSTSYRLIAVPKNVVGPLANAIYENFPEVQDELDIQTTVRGVVFNADIVVEEDFDKELQALVKAIQADVKTHSDVQLYIRLPMNFRNSKIKPAEFHGYLRDCELSKEPIFNELYSMRGRASVVHRCKREIVELLSGMEKQKHRKAGKSEPGNDGDFIEESELGIRQPVVVNHPENLYQSLVAQVHDAQADYFAQPQTTEAGPESKRLAGELEQLSKELWEAEQQLLKNQVTDLKRRLAAIETKLELREKRRAELVQRRLEELKTQKLSVVEATPQGEPTPILPVPPMQPQQQPETEQAGKRLPPEAPTETDATRAVEVLLSSNNGEFVVTPRQQSVHNLTKLNQALLNYHAAKGHFPPASKSITTQVIFDGPGKIKPFPKVSWRVELLPWLGEDELYRQYRIDEPWDSEQNKKLLAKMPDIYRSALDPSDSQNSAFYAVVSESKRQVGKPEYSTLFGNPAGSKYSDVHDGTANTIALVELDLKIPWTKPEDLQYDPDQPLPKLPLYEETGFHAGFIDGAVRRIQKETDEEQIRRFFEMKDGLPTKLPPIVNAFGTVLLQPVKPQPPKNPSAQVPVFDPFTPSNTLPETRQLEKEILHLEVLAAKQKLEAAQQALKEVKNAVERNLVSSQELSNKELAVNEAAIAHKRAELALQRGIIDQTPDQAKSSFEIPKSHEMLRLDLELAEQIDKLVKEDLVRIQEQYLNGAASLQQVTEAKSKAIQAEHDVKRLQLALKPTIAPDAESFASQSSNEGRSLSASEATPDATRYSIEELQPRIKEAFTKLGGNYDLEDEETYIIGSVSASHHQQHATIPQITNAIALKIMKNHKQETPFTESDYQKSSVFIFRLQPSKRKWFTLRPVGSAKIHRQDDEVLSGIIIKEEENEKILPGDLFVAIKNPKGLKKTFRPHETPKRTIPVTPIQPEETSVPPSSIPSSPFTNNTPIEVKSPADQRAKITRGKDSYTVSNATLIEKSVEAIEAVLKLPTADQISVSRGVRNDTVSVSSDVETKQLSEEIEKIVRNRKEVYLLKHDDGHLFIDAGPKEASDVTKSLIDAIQSSRAKPKESEPSTKD